MFYIVSGARGEQHHAERLRMSDSPLQHMQRVFTGVEGINEAELRRQLGEFRALNVWGKPRRRFSLCGLLRSCRMCRMCTCVGCVDGVDCIGHVGCVGRICINRVGCADGINRI